LSSSFAWPLEMIPSADAMTLSRRPERHGD